MNLRRYIKKIITESDTHCKCPGPPPYIIAVPSNGCASGGSGCVEHPDKDPDNSDGGKTKGTTKTQAVVSNKKEMKEQGQGRKRARCKAECNKKASMIRFSSATAKAQWMRRCIMKCTGIPGLGWGVNESNLRNVIRRALKEQKKSNINQETGNYEFAQDSTYVQQPPQMSDTPHSKFMDGIDGLCDKIDGMGDKKLGGRKKCDGNMTDGSGGCYEPLIKLVKEYCKTK